MRGTWRAAALVAALGTAGVASAHEFDCRKTVNGGPLYTVTRYPATLHYRFDVINTHPSATSVALEVSDPRLAHFGFRFHPATPFSVPVGGSVSDDFWLRVPDYQACLALAASDGLQDNVFDNAFRVRWDLGSDHCSARVVCLPPGPDEQDGGTPPTDGGTPPTDGGTPPTDGGQPGACITRTQGFWSTHTAALTQCMAAGPIQLGWVTLHTVTEAQFILSGNVNTCGTPGSEERALGRARMQLGQQAVAAICNTRAFGTAPPSALAPALGALETTSCDAITSYIDDLTAFNEGCDTADFPPGYVPGPATPGAPMTDPGVCDGLGCGSPALR